MSSALDIRLTASDTINLDDTAIRVAGVLAAVRAVSCVANSVISIDELLARSLAVVAREEESAGAGASACVLRSASPKVSVQVRKKS